MNINSLTATIIQVAIALVIFAITALTVYYLFYLNRSRCPKCNKLPQNKGKYTTEKLGYRYYTILTYRTFHCPRCNEDFKVLIDIDHLLP